MFIGLHAVSTLSLWLKEVLLPYGGYGLMVLAICDSSFLSLSGVNDVLLITFSVARPQSMYWFAGMTAAGSVLGCAILYAVGRKGGETFLRKRFADSRLARVQHWYGKFGVVAVIVPALLPPPIPLKLFVLSAGAFGISWSRFLTGISIGRCIRYFALGILAVAFGNAAIDFVSLYFAKIGIGLAAVVVVGTLIYIRFRRKSRSTAP
jgi:membrane protein YqaA with SNARE-associated domain